MKRLCVAVACILLFAATAGAQENASSLRQCVALYMDYFKESMGQASRARAMAQQGKQDPAHPLTETCLFYTELASRQDQLTLLAINLADLYNLYNKTTYCYTKEEKRYLFNRIDSILSDLQQIIDLPYLVDTSSRDGAKAQMHDEVTALAERVSKLQLFVRASLPLLRR